MGFSGQSLAKCVARATFWTAISSGGLQGPVCFSGMSGTRCLVLLGPDAGDVGTILALGGSQSAIVGVDTSEECVLRARGRFPELDARHGDVLRVLARSDRFDCVFLDFCGHVSRSMALTVWRIIDRHCSDGCFFGVGFMRGREKVDFKSKRRSVHATNNGIEILSVDGPADDQRSQVLSRWVAERSIAYHRGWVPRHVLEVLYQGTGVPMTYSLFRKERVQRSGVFDLGGGRRFKVEPQSIRSAAIFLSDTIGPARASLALGGLPPGRIAAWKAHATRGTYNKRSA